MDDDWESFREDYQQRFNKTVTPDSLRPWLRYAQKHQCNERDYYDGIETDLQVFRDIIVAQGNQKFRQEDIVAKGANQTSFYMVLQLQNHKWTMLDTVDYHKKGPLPLMKIEKQLQWLMEPVRAHRPAINNTFFFNLHDGARNKDSDRPIFSTCKQAYWTDDVAIPTDEEVVNLLVNDMTRFPFQQHNYQTYNGQVQDDHKMDAGIRDVLIPFYNNLPTGHAGNEPLIYPLRSPFDERDNSIVWRGSTTGPWGWGPRFKLVQTYGGDNVTFFVIDRNNKEDSIKVDFGFTLIVQGKNKTLPPHSRMADYMSYSDMQRHKYVMDVDGNSFTERFPSLLESGSLVFKSTRYREWFTDRLVAYRDYIPVNYNQSDLAEKVAWAHKNAELTAQITQHARRTVQKQMRTEDMRCYVYRLMMEYQTLFEETP